MPTSMTRTIKPVHMMANVADTAATMIYETGHIIDNVHHHDGYVLGTIDLCTVHASFDVAETEAASVLDLLDAVAR